MDYQEFLESKKHTIGNFGFDANYIPDIAFDFQKAIIEKAVNKGRMAIFADTGLGKTLMQVSIAQNIVNHTNKKVLILTPLAVAFQFIIEAEKLGIDDIEYSKTGKLSHIIWQRYASSVWDDIDGRNVLPYREAKEEDDEKHVHPLQLDVIDRIVELYTNPNEVVLTPFMGVGSEVYSPVSLGRRAIGIELKESYFKQAIRNMKEVNSRYQDDNQLALF